jgi:hypothetical protein
LIKKYLFDELILHAGAWLDEGAPHDY